MRYAFEIRSFDGFRHFVGPCTFVPIGISRGESPIVSAGRERQHVLARPRVVDIDGGVVVPGSRADIDAKAHHAVDQRIRELGRCLP